MAGLTARTMKERIMPLTTTRLNRRNRLRMSPESKTMQVRSQYQKSSFSTIKYKKYKNYTKSQPPNIIPSHNLQIYQTN